MILKKISQSCSRKNGIGGVERKSIKIWWVGGVSLNINVLYGGILPILIVLVGVIINSYVYSLLIITTLSVNIAPVNGRPGVNYVQKLSTYAEIFRPGSPRDVLFSGITSVYGALTVLCIAKCQHALLIDVILCIQRLC